MPTEPSSLTSLFCYASLLMLMLGLSTVSRRRARRRNSPRPQSAQAPTTLSTYTHTPTPTPLSRPQNVSSSQTYVLIPTLLTDAEQRFFVTLSHAVPDGMLVCPQVRLANLVQPATRNARQKKYDFYRIQAKCVDFVVCDAATTKPRLVIELDDASHQRSDRQARDTFVDMVLTQVGLPILHVPWQRSYDAQSLREAIQHRIFGVFATSAPARPFDTAVSSSWLTPIAVEAGSKYEHGVQGVATTHKVTYVCGQCQREVRREAKFCNHCGALL